MKLPVKFFFIKDRPSVFNVDVEEGQLNVIEEKGIVNRLRLANALCIKNKMWFRNTFNALSVKCISGQ